MEHMRIVETVGRNGTAAALLVAKASMRAKDAAATDQRFTPHPACEPITVL